MKKIYFKKEHLILLTIFITAFLIRLYFAINNKIITEMGVYYFDLAKNLILNKSYTCNYLDLIFAYNTIPFHEMIHPPMFPLLITMFFSLLGIGFLQAKLVNVFLGSILVVITYFFSKQIFDKKIALFSSVLVAFFAPLITFSSIIHAEILVIILIMLSFTMFLLSIRKRNEIFFLLSAVFYGLCILTKTYMAFFFPLFMLAFLIKNRKKSLIKRVFVFASITILITLPWVIYTYDKTSEFSSLMLFIPTNIVSEKNGGLDTQEFYTRSNIHPNDIIEQTLKSTSFLEYFSVSFKNAFASFFFITPIVMMWPFFLLGISGIAYYYINSKKNIALLLFFIFVYYLCSIYPSDSERYIILLSPFYLIFSSFMLFKLIRLISASFKLNNNILNYIFIFGIILFLFFNNLKIPFSPPQESLIPNYGGDENLSFSLATREISLSYWRYLYSGEPDSWVNIGNMIKQWSNSSTVVSSFHPQIAYYAGTKWVATPYSGYDSFITILKKFNTNYLVLYEYDAVYHPEIRSLLESSDKIPDSLELIASNDTHQFKVFKII